MTKVESSKHLFALFNEQREQLQYSQRKANKEAGVSSATWSLIDAREDKNMNVKTAIAYAKALDLQIELVGKK
jgi:DNA-binding XRE family transcriptional regulator